MLSVDLGKGEEKAGLRTQFWASLGVACWEGMEVLVVLVGVWWLLSSFSVIVGGLVSN